MGKSPPISDEKDGNEKEDAIFMDSDVKHEDRMTQDRIKAILHDHSQEMANYIPAEKKKIKKQPYATNIGPDGEVVRTGPKESLDDVEMEDGKRNIIHRFSKFINFTMYDVSFTIFHFNVIQRLFWASSYNLSIRANICCIRLFLNLFLLCRYIIGHFLAVIM